LSNLGPDSSIRELFDIVQVEEGVNVVPVTISKADDNIARNMIVICGSREEASLLTANLMAYVDQMYAAVEQAQADKEAEDEPSIVVP
jgi:phosphoribosylcarboxyaminoimidazole (NCAIR) mutase